MQFIYVSTFRILVYDCDLDYYASNSRRIPISTEIKINEIKRSWSNLR
jgi:hypothetical protein